jgi:AcrR family transcriptional regulator
LHTVARMSVDQRRSLLIDAAIAVMARDGVANVGTRAIVAEADMTIGVFHYCFRSKDELVIEVLRTINQRSFAAVGDILSRGTDAADLLQAGIQAYWDHIKLHPTERMLIFELTQYSLRNPGWRDAANEQYEHYFKGMQAFLEAVAERGGITWRSDVGVLARWVLANLQGITIQWLVGRDGAVACSMLGHLGAHLVDEAGLEPTGWVPDE